MTALLENGAEANAQSRKRGVTALMIAASNGDEDVVKLLLEHGAKTDLADIFRCHSRAIVPVVTAIPPL